jgi:selenocysteine lyase/cysteine desulfurase
VCSPYKFLGPHCGVLAAPDPELLETLAPDKLIPSTNSVPERFELGTLPYEVMAGATAAVDFLAGVAPGESLAEDRRSRLSESWECLERHEHDLRVLLEDGVNALTPHLVVHSRASSRTPTMLLTIPGRSTWQAYEFLARRNVLAPAGSFYAYEPFRRLSLHDDHALRLGLAPYNNVEDINRVIDGLTSFIMDSTPPPPQTKPRP